MLPESHSTFIIFARQRQQYFLLTMCRKTMVVRRYGNYSEASCKDMLGRYVPEHHGGRTPLQLSAVTPAYNLVHNLVYDQVLGCSETISGCDKMIAHIVASGANVHEAAHYRTPLLLFLSTLPGMPGSNDVNAANLRPRHLRLMLKAWLNILKGADVDLITYGAEESRSFQAHRSWNDYSPGTIWTLASLAAKCSTSRFPTEPRRAIGRYNSTT
jgi:hypothetical protein